MKKIFLLFFAFILTSCTCTMYRVFNNQKSIFKYKKVLVKDNREIIYLANAHLGSEKYFEEIKDYINQKRKEGYVIYYEGITREDIENENLQDTLNLKFRKLLGYSLKGSYADEDNKSLPKCFKKYVGQTMTNTGINNATDINVDLSLNKLLDLYEAKYGKINLDECDFNTPLNEKYKCGHLNAEYTISHKFRDEYLIEKLLNSKDDKIVLLYGRAHWLQAIYPTLVHKNGYKLVEGKI